MDLVWQVKTLAVMLFGIGIKLAIYDPSADPHAHAASTQRYELGAAVCTCFVIQLAHTILLKSPHHYASIPRSARRLPKHILLLAARLTLLGVSVAVCSLPTRPALLVLVQAALAVPQCALLHAQETSAAAHSALAGRKSQHPLHETPLAIDALRLKAGRFRAAHAAAAAAADDDDDSECCELGERSSEAVVEGGAWGSKETVSSASAAVVIGNANAP